MRSVLSAQSYPHSVLCVSIPDVVCVCVVFVCVWCLCGVCVVCGVCGVCVVCVVFVCGVWCVLRVCVDVPMCLFPTAVIVSSQCSSGNRPVRAVGSATGPCGRWSEGKEQCRIVMH